MLKKICFYIFTVLPIVSFMGNIATLVDEQMQKLEGRGMKLPDRGKCEEMLLDIGYYRLGFYWKFFEVDDEHNFQPDTCFSNIVKLYYFDIDLRYCLIKYVHRIETFFKTQLIYIVSNANKKQPCWFVDPKIVDAKYVSEFDDKVYNSYFRKNNPISKHHTKYINDKYAPAWKTLEFMTFGSLLRLYKSLKNEDLKRQIASKFDVKKVQLFENFMETLVYLRNVLSHNGILYDFSVPKGIKNVPGGNNKYHKWRLLHTIEVVKFLLNPISKNRANELDKYVNEILEDLYQNQSLSDIIKHKLGHINLN